MAMASQTAYSTITGRNSGEILCAVGSYTAPIKTDHRRFTVGCLPGIWLFRREEHLSGIRGTLHNPTPTTHIVCRPAQLGPSQAFFLRESSDSGKKR